MQLGHYLTLLEQAQRRLAVAFRSVADGHREEVDVFAMCRRLAEQCDAHAEQLAPVRLRYAGAGGGGPEPGELHSDLFRGPRDGPLGVLRDLHDLYLMASECGIVWTVVGQAARGARDDELLQVVEACEAETEQQRTWVRSRMREAAPQALVVA
jgi:hypothetical protein